MPHTSSYSPFCNWCRQCCRALGCCFIEKSVSDENELVISSIEVHPEVAPQYRLQTAVHSAQHPNKPLKGPNCDRFIHSPSVIAVADGVNSVANEGVNPVKFPIQLLDRCISLINKRRLNPPTFDELTTTMQLSMGLHLPKADEVDQYGAITKSFVSPSSQFLVRLVCRAATETSEIGASTLCIGVIEGSILHIANVGDSGLYVFRLKAELDHNGIEKWKYRLICRTTPGLSKFNTPYQIMRMDIEGTMINDADVAKGVAFGVTINSCSIEDGDILVCCTDGLTDNLHLSQIEDVLNSICIKTVIPTRGVSRVPLIGPNEIATRLVQLASSNASTAPAPGSELSLFKLPTPFALKLYEHRKQILNGGKPDDITVVVAYVEEVKPLPSLNRKLDIQVHQKGNSTQKLDKQKQACSIKTTYKPSNTRATPVPKCNVVDGYQSNPMLQERSAGSYVAQNKVARSGIAATNSKSHGYESERSQMVPCIPIGSKLINLDQMNSLKYRAKKPDCQNEQSTNVSSSSLLTSDRSSTTALLITKGKHLPDGDVVDVPLSFPENTALLQGTPMTKCHLSRLPHPRINQIKNTQKTALIRVCRTPKSLTLESEPIRRHWGTKKPRSFDRCSSDFSSNLTVWMKRLFVTCL